MLGMIGATGGSTRSTLFPTTVVVVTAREQLLRLLPPNRLFSLFYMKLCSSNEYEAASILSSLTFLHISAHMKLENIMHEGGIKAWVQGGN